jgi:hypothetical protein
MYLGQLPKLIHMNGEAITAMTHTHLTVDAIAPARVELDA